MTRISKYSIIGLIGVALLGGAVACSHHYKDPEHRAEYFQSKITKELDLNEVQQAKLQSMVEVMMQVRQEMKAEFENSHQSIDALLQQPQLDRDGMLAMVNRHTTMMNQNAPRVVNAMADFYDSLNDEQRAELREHISKHRGKGHHGGHHGMH